MSDRMYNIAVIGAGAVSSYGHLPAIAASKRWRLSAICDTDLTRLAKANQARLPPDRLVTLVETLVKLPDLDAVVVATHLESHRDITIAALQAGLHVLCEKPMAASQQHCQEMVDAAAKAGRLLAINFNGRSQHAYRDIAAVVASGSLGRILVTRIGYLWSAHQWKPPERLAHFMANGGPIIDSGVHFFDAVRLFTGSEFVNIEAKGVFQQPEEHPKHVIATCKMADGSIALVEAGWLHTKNTKEMDAIYHLELVGERGSVRADLTTGAFTVFTEQGTEVRKSGDGGKDFDWVYERFAASIDAGRVVGLASGVDGIKATNAAFAALASAHEDRTRDGGLAGSGVKEGRISTSAAAL